MLLFAFFSRCLLLFTLLTASISHFLSHRCDKIFLLMLLQRYLFLCYPCKCRHQNIVKTKKNDSALLLIFLSKSPGGTARSKCNIWHRLTCRGGRSDGHVMTKISRIYWLPFFLTHGVSLLGDVDLVPTKVRFNCGRQEEPAILISRLLIRMRRMYEASIRLDFTKNVWNSQNAI